MSPLLIESLFWTTLFLIGFSYIGYPLVIWMLARNKSRQLNSKEQEPVDAGSLPRVSIIIAAYREEAVILERLNNLARLDYPSSKLEILIGCDGNEDLTGELVSAYGNDQIRLIQFEQRRGKASVLNDCVPQASGEILVFSDANTNMDPQCLKQMVRHFQEESTG